MTISIPQIPYRRNFLLFIVLVYVFTLAHRTEKNSIPSSKHWQPVMASICRKKNFFWKQVNGRFPMAVLQDVLHSSLLIICLAKKNKTLQEGV